MSFIARVDSALCEGHGQCLLAAPGLFEADDDGYSQVVDNPISDDGLRPAIEQAVRACPAGAISVSATAQLS